jgi:hypothetical protein
MSYTRELAKTIALEKELLKSITSINNRIKNYFDKGGENDTLKLECLLNIQSFYKEQLQIVNKQKFNK